MNQPRESLVSPDSSPKAEQDLRVLFHRLNNQLGIILACAELVELNATDGVSRTRATEIVSKVFDALGTAKEIRHRTDLL